MVGGSNIFGTGGGINNYNNNTMAANNIFNNNNNASVFNKINRSNIM